jgi:hypothetical protein
MQCRPCVMALSVAPAAYVSAVLDEGHSAQRASHPQRGHWYRCNIVAGGELEALPTLVAYPGSRAFRMQGGVPSKGMLYVEPVKRRDPARGTMLSRMMLSVSASWRVPDQLHSCAWCV